MKSIDAEILEVEQRLSLRKVALKHAAGEARTRTLKAMVSPVTLVGAVALGFLVAGGLGRRKARPKAPAVSRETKEQGKGFALGTLLMTGATWFIRSQFGGPVGLAQFVLSKVKGSRSPATAVPARIPR
jgi:ABC-type methionine transport system permease subunit